MVRANALGTLIGAALGLAVMWSCTVNTRSDQLACTKQADCSNGRVCEGGYCVVGSLPADARIDAPLICPSQCASCTFSNQSCTIHGGGGPVSCPLGWNCTISCPTAGACSMVDCSGAQSCDITCGIEGACGNITCSDSRCTVGCTATGSGTPTACGTVNCSLAGTCDLTCTGSGACADLQCGLGACTETCNGSGACGNTSCASSCRCNVNCNPDLGACGTMMCPSRGAHYCATNGSAGSACDSNAFANCSTTCP